MNKHVLTRDILIPAGTEVFAPPSNISRWGKDSECLVSLHPDLCGYLSMDLREALELGVVESRDETD